MTDTDFDQQHIWHPYSSMPSALPAYPVKSASGVMLTLDDGRELVDGMASWWCAIHGYNVPQLNEAIENQLENMAHVMFGGLTHEPAVELAKKLVSITPEKLQSVFFADSGSVAVEIALKLALQYWHAKGDTQRQKFLALKGGYHGDTFAAMSVCDPVSGMHAMFNEVLPVHYFADAPSGQHNAQYTDADLNSFKQQIEQHHRKLAAVILEPIVQGAGGMRFYAPQFLQDVRALCDKHGVLLITDEIATGFGRTGKLFACEQANITPDIMCVGKALTGGYISLAATLMSNEIAGTISGGEPGLFMHGPTFMANPLACAVANASIELLLNSPWQQRVSNIETQLLRELKPARDLKQVKDVRVLGAIGVIETHQAVDQTAMCQAFVDAGVWVRPFSNLVYIMPSYIIEPDELTKLTSAMLHVVSRA